MRHILLKTTIPHDSHNWHIGHFSHLADYLRSLRDAHSNLLFQVDARDRLEDERGNDPELVGLPYSDYQQLWLFGVEEEGGLSYADLMAINAFRQRGGGLLLSRGPGDIGASLALLDTVGVAQRFPSMHVALADGDESDDPETWATPPPAFPRHCSGRLGEAQIIDPQEPVHPLLRRSDGGVIQQLPACPAEAEVVVPEGAEAMARVIATAQSPAGRFNLAVSFERHHDRWGEFTGRALAEAAFQRFCNEQLVANNTNSAALADTQAYIGNIARWLAALDDEATHRQN